MPSLSIGIPNLQQSGPIIEILIGLSQPVLEALKKEGKPTPELRRCNAMIDTGASSTVIKEGISKELNLKSRGVTNISTPSCSQYETVTFDVAIIFPQHNIVRPIVTVIEAPLERQNIDCLIGRDLLKDAILIYEGYANRFILSF